MNYYPQCKWDTKIPTSPQFVLSSVRMLELRRKGIALCLSRQITRISQRTERSCVLAPHEMVVADSRGHLDKKRTWLLAVRLSCDLFKAVNLISPGPLMNQGRPWGVLPMKGNIVLRAESCVRKGEEVRTLKSAFWAQYSYKGIITNNHGAFQTQKGFACGAITTRSDILYTRMSVVRYTL